MLDAIWMICQSCTDSLLLAHVAIHAIATDLGAVVVGSNSPMFHIVHHWYNITQNSPLVKRFFNFFRATGERVRLSLNTPNPIR